MHTSLVATQCGGRPGMGTDHATHTVLTGLQIAKHRQQTAILATADLAPAFYMVLLEIVLSLPKEEDDIKQVLDHITIPPCSLEAVQRSMRGEAVVNETNTDPHFAALVAEVNGRPWWKMREAKH